MEYIQIMLDADKYNKALHGGLDENPVLPEKGDLAFYVKPNATVGGKAGIVVTFTVQLPDGTLARAQAVTTLANFENALAVVRGWRSGGHV